MIKRLLRKIYQIIHPPKVRVKHGKRFYSNSLIDTLFPELIEIGDDFVSAPGSIILAHDASTFMHTGKYRVQKTIIGNRVFLGANSVVLPGIVIGDDVIIGSGAVVTKNISNGSVVAGNPARVILTVNEYMDKCNKRKNLYNANESFINLIKAGESISEKEQEELRKFIYTQLEIKKNK